MKSNHFDNCSTEDNIKEEVGNLMEIKFPIHTRRMAGIKPILRSNKDASTFMKRVLVNFKNGKMSQCHWENLLTHLILNSLPDSETFKKQRDFIASYLSDIGRKKGGTAKANLNHIENGLIHIEADLRSKGQPTSQSINSAKKQKNIQY